MDSSRITNSTLAMLREIVGDGRVLTSEQDRLCYSYDSQHVEMLPDAVVQPADAEQVSKVLKLANSESFPVVPRGAGTGLSGGSIIQGGVVLDLCRMDRILEVDTANRLITMEPGVITARLAAAAEAEGLLYPPDPGSINVCTIGGNVAENAGGLRALKYGVTRDYLMALEVVSPTGELFRMGARTMKSVAGYDLTGLMCGSEGTLGVITKITVRAVPLPLYRRSMLAVFGELEEAAEAVSAILSAGVTPATLEIMDNTTIRLVEDFKKAGLPVDAGAILLVEVDGASEMAVREEAETAERVLRDKGAVEVTTAENAQTREKLWEARRSALAALARSRPTTVLEDVTVPMSELARMVSRINQIAERHSLLVGTFGHAGDGNLHPTFLVDERDADEMARLQCAIKETFHAAISLGGTVSGEHGVGFTKAEFLPLEVGSEAVGVMRAIKQALDPQGILNPGKIFQ